MPVVLRDLDTGERLLQCMLCNRTKPDTHENWHNGANRRTRSVCTSCCGGFRLQRDLANPMDRDPEKRCTKCGKVKPNTFGTFGRKLWRGRDEFTTPDICLVCQYKNRRDRGQNLPD